MIMRGLDIVTAALPMLLASALRALFVAAVAASGLAVFRTKATTARLLVWRTVLLAALAMPFLASILPSTSISAGFLHSANIQPTIAASRFAVHAQSRPLIKMQEPSASQSLPITSGSVSPAQRPASSKIPFSWSFIPWTTLIGATYFLVAGIFLVRLVLGVVLSRRLIRGAQRIDRPTLRRALADQANVLPTPARILQTESISVPVTMGVLQPLILLPSSWIQWDQSTLSAVIAHEASHVARRDALTQYVSLLHRAVFWFSPLAWWLDRHLAALAEEASDEAALSHGADRNTYARTLLGFFETLQTAPGRIRWQGVSMANGGRAEQRLERILAWKGSLTMHLQKSALIAIIVFAVPVIYLAASARPANGKPGATTQETISAPPVPASAPVAAVPAAAPRAGVASPAIMPAPPAQGVAALTPVAPVAPFSSFAWSSAQSSGTGPGFSYAYGYDDDDRFVIVSGKSDSYTMSGSTQDIHHVERLKKQIPGDFIWFQRDEKSYIIRDQATIDRAKALWAPQEELGKKQEALGKQQEALGKQQEELGNKMEQVRVNVPTDLTAKLDALKAKLQKLGPTATMEQVGDLQSEIGDLQSQIGEIQGRAGEQQGKLGEEQGKLGEQQGKLGEEQGKLGEEQGKLAEEAAKKTKALFDECIKNGKALPEPDGSHGASL